MINKKAFELQFNWIFILVAGAAILLFFTVVIIKQKNISEISTKTTVLKSIEAIITGAGVSTDTTKVIDIPNSNIEVSCSKVSIGMVSKQYQNLILFAPSLIKGNKIITQTLTFNVPYRATNFLYMTSPQIRYIIIGDNGLANEINKSLPSDLRKEFYRLLPDIKNLNNYKVRFIVFNEMINFPKSLEKMPDSDVTAIKVNGNKEKGTIGFYQKDGTSWLSKGTSSYLGKAALIGAVYTDTLEAYECNMQNSFSRLNLVTRIYKDRTNVLKGTAQSQCKELYDKASTDLDKIFDYSLKFETSKINDIVNAANSLADKNKEAQKNSCTLIY